MPSMLLPRPCGHAGRDALHPRRLVVKRGLVASRAPFAPSVDHGRTRGFTLVEILVVVAILSMLAGVAVHQLLRARITIHEHLALNSLRLIAKSCHFFYLMRQEFPSDLTELGPPTSDPPFLESALLQGSPPAKQGYVFEYLRPTMSTFTLRANPQMHGVTGERHFFVDQDLVIHATTADQDATAADPPIS